MLCVRALHNPKKSLPHYSQAFPYPYWIIPHVLLFPHMLHFPNTEYFLWLPSDPFQVLHAAQSDVARLDTVSRKGLTSLSGMEGLPHYYPHYYP